MTPGRIRFLIQAVILLFAFLMQAQLLRWMSGTAVFESSRRRRLILWGVNGIIGLWLLASLALTVPRFWVIVPPTAFLQWNIGIAIAWVMTICGVFPVILFLRRAPQFDPSRRKLLRAAQATLVAAPVATIAFGVVVNRRKFELVEVNVRIPGLPAGLDGLRLAQLTDLHAGAFLSRRELERAVGMVNDTRPHLAFVTGDLITLRGDPLDECMSVLSGLRTEAGIAGSLGNHEGYMDAMRYTAEAGARLGIDFLRHRNRQFRFSGATLNVAGIDYLPGRTPALPGAGSLVVPGAVNVLLSHNPNVFPAAAREGFQLTVSGHTHGGQIAMEILNQSITLVRFLTPYVHGLFEKDGASLYVSRGVGTVAVPARLGAPPEVTLIRLCAT